MGWIVGILVVLVLLLLWIVGIYNRLVRLRNEVKNGWSQIDVQLQRRYDLIPNLVETVKGYMQYEQTTLIKVVEARSAAVAAREEVAKEGGPTGKEGTLQKLIAAERNLGGALSGVFALAESYPALRASENMQRLQEELTATENKVAFSRQNYNDVVMLYNMTQQQFPTVLLATTFGHKPADLFQIEEQGARKPIKVAF